MSMNRTPHHAYQHSGPVRWGRGGGGGGRGGRWHVLSEHARHLRCVRWSAGYSLWFMSFLPRVSREPETAVPPRDFMSLMLDWVARTPRFQVSSR